MKPISILLSTICTLCAVSSYAQTSSSVTTPVSVNIAPTQEIQPKVYFQSKMSEFDVYTSRNTKSMAESAYKDLKQMMEDFLKDTELKIANTNGADEATLQQKLTKQQNAFAAITALSSDLMANHEAIKQQLQEFLQTLY